MAGSYRILEAHNLAYFRFHGTVTTPQCVAMLSAYAADPLANPEQAHFSDLSEVTQIKADHQTMLQMILQIAQISRYERSTALSAVYVPNSGFHEIMGVYRRLCDEFLSVRVQVFREETAALTYIGHPDTRLSTLLA